MTRLLFLLALALFLLIGVSQQSPVKGRSYVEEYNSADKLYHNAGLLSSRSDYTDAMAERELSMNRAALDGFKKVLPPIIADGNDSLTFFCYYKLGVLEHYFDSLSAAKDYYSLAISIKNKLPQLPDSILFKPYLYLGAIQYSFNQFDSALFNYKRAEQIVSRYPGGLEGTNRLYNTLGAMYYETANYRQAANYFQKALDILSEPGAANDALRVNYQVNLAATFTRLGKYDEANRLYEELLKQDINRNEILHNAGTTKLLLGDGAAAMNYFRQVNYTNNKQVRLLNDIGQAFEKSGYPDSARSSYLEALQENEKWNGRRKNVQAGLAWKYLAELDDKRSSFHEALKKYQNAIIQFTGDFNETDISKDPQQFSSVYSYINLFQTLVGKAATLEHFYRKVTDTRKLEAALATYRSAFRLADYVEKTYDSDEARLFLNRIKYTAHSKPIAVSLTLFEQTRDNNFLEEAYLFDQRNKASILSLNVSENEWRRNGHGDSVLLSRESVLRAAITRASLKAAQTSDSAELISLHATIRDNEILLGKTQDEIRRNPAFSESNVAERIPTVAQVQKELDENTAVISYHLSPGEMLALTITRDRFLSSRITLDTSFFPTIDSFKRALHDVSGTQRFSGAAFSTRLYNTLISPILPGLTGIKRLVIIPDDELNYLPFEALRIRDGHYLLEDYAVQYQYSTALLKKSTRSANPDNILSFAPFTAKGFKDSVDGDLSVLPSSRQEVSELKGKVYVDEQATKANFFKTANRYGVIHLATHASVNNEKPERSFIAFYPSENEDDFRLYAQEIYDMQLDSTQLIILSACETGDGRLEKGEGLMSLSRAFAYAGCHNIITSLWQAEDKTTAYITQRLHYYLEKGYRKDKALQQAKLDLLNNSSIDPRLKSPSYWAHLVFIGEYESSSTLSVWWPVGASIATALFIILVANRQARRRRSKLVMLD